MRILIIALTLVGCLPDPDQRVNSLISTKGGIANIRNYDTFGLSLQIENCRVDEEVCDSLAELHRLASLTFENCEFYADTVVQLKSLTSLKHLRFIKCENLSTAELNLFAFVKRLEIEFPKMTSIERLPDKSLLELRLKHALIEPSALRDLERNANLDSLKVVSCTVTDSLQLPKSIEELEFIDSEGDFVSSAIDSQAKVITISGRVLSVTRCWQLLTDSEVIGLNLRRCVVRGDVKDTHNITDGELAYLMLDLRDVKLPEGFLSEVLSRGKIWTLAIDARLLSAATTKVLCQHNAESLAMLDFGKSNPSERLLSQLAVCRQLKYVHCAEPTSAAFADLETSFKIQSSSDSRSWRYHEWK